MRYLPKPPVDVEYPRRLGSASHSLPSLDFRGPPPNLMRSGEMLKRSRLSIKGSAPLCVLTSKLICLLPFALQYYLRRRPRTQRFCRAPQISILMGSLPPAWCRRRRSTRRQEPNASNGLGPGIDGMALRGADVSNGGKGQFGRDQERARSDRVTKAERRIF